MIVKALVNRGALVTVRDYGGRTPLHHAVRDVEVAGILVDHGADVNESDNDGWTPLHWASKLDSVAVARMLLDRGADVSTRLHDGRTPRDLAKFAKMRNVFDEALLWSGPQLPLDRVPLYLCGYGHVGKSTFARALQRSSWLSIVSSLPKRNEERTHGFDVLHVDVPDGVGDCTIFDFAGQYEYWVSHGLLMSCAVGIFFVLCDLGDTFEDQRKQLDYWLRFIASTTPEGTTLTVALVGTHRSEHATTQMRKEALDSVKLVGQRWRSAHVDETFRALRSEFEGLVNIHEDAFFYIDSISQNLTDRKEMLRLRKWLAGACAYIRATEMMPLICSEARRVIERKLRSALPLVVPFEDVKAAFKEYGSKTAEGLTDDRLRAVLGYLANAGCVMYFEGVNNSVVLDPQQFGTRVVGQLFAPSGATDFRSMLIDSKRPIFFSRADLEGVLASSGVGCTSNVLNILQALELCFSFDDDADDDGDGAADCHDSGRGHATESPGHAAKARPENATAASTGDGRVDGLPQLFAVPGRLAQKPSRDRERAIDQFCSMPSECWKELHALGGAEWMYTGVRLRVQDSHFVIPPGAFPRLQHRLSTEPGFRMWHHGVRVCRRHLVEGRNCIATEAVAELDEHMRHVEIRVRSEFGAAAWPQCVDELRKLADAVVNLHKRTKVTFTASLLDDEYLRARPCRGDAEAAHGDPAADPEDPVTALDRIEASFTRVSPEAAKRTLLYRRAERMLQHTVNVAARFADAEFQRMHAQVLQDSAHVAIPAGAVPSEYVPPAPRPCGRDGHVPSLQLGCHKCQRRAACEPLDTYAAAFAALHSAGAQAMCWRNSDARKWATEGCHVEMAKTFAPKLGSHDRAVRKMRFDDLDATAVLNAMSWCTGFHSDYRGPGGLAQAALHARNLLNHSPLNLPQLDEADFEDFRVRMRSLLDRIVQEKDEQVAVAARKTIVHIKNEDGCAYAEAAAAAAQKAQQHLLAEETARLRAQLQESTVTFPPEWTEQADDGGDRTDVAWWRDGRQLVPVNRDTDEWERAARLMHESLPAAELTAVERFENRLLWKSYAAKRAAVALKRGGDANEQWLWHGTGDLSPADALQHEAGMDPRFSRAGYYGGGLYLAERARYSNYGRYPHVLQDRRRRQLVLLRAAVGRPRDYGHTVSKETRALTMPPQEGPGVLFDAVRGGLHHPERLGVHVHPDASRMVVLYDLAQAYPAFIVTYTLPP